MHWLHQTSRSHFRQLILISLLTLAFVITPHAVNAQSVPDVPAPDTQTAKSSAFLPLVVNGSAAAAPAVWSLNTQEEQVEALFRNDAEQRRQNPTRNDILSQVARARAQDMAQRNYFSHTDPDGHQPNFKVKQAGYLLPDFYPSESNNIESIGLNYTAPADAWQAWKNSPAHRVHVLGEETFYAAQTDYGIGYAESANGKYWVLITARH